MYNIHMIHAAVRFFCAALDLPSAATAHELFCKMWTALLPGEDMKPVLVEAAFTMEGCQILMSDGIYPTKLCFKGSNTVKVMTGLFTIMCLE